MERLESTKINQDSQKQSLDSKALTESKTITQSPTSKTLCEALPDSNNGRDSANLAQLQNCAIFAAQKWQNLKILGL